MSEQKDQQKTIELTEEQKNKVMDTDVSTKVSFIVQVMNIVEYGRKKGVFEFNELEGVVKMYNNLKAVVEDAAKKVLEPESSDEDKKVTFEDSEKK